MFPYSRPDPDSFGISDMTDNDWLEISIELDAAMGK